VTRYGETRAIDVMVWIDGVEVPFNTISLQFGMDTPSRVSISVEPDEIIDLWRPKAWVHVWVRDPFLQTTPENRAVGTDDQRDKEYDLDTYELFWEGEVVAIQDQETQDSRQTVIEAHDLYNIAMNTDISLVDVGAGLQVAYINGSSFFGSVFGDAAQTQNLIVAAMLKFLTEDTSAVKRKGIAELGIQVLKFLSQFNASFGFQAWRTDMFFKFTGIPDASMSNFVNLAMLRDIVGIMQAIQPSSNVLGYMQQMISRFYHHFTSIPFPSPRQDGQSRSQVWNSMLVLPNLYYALPPLCNWLFPENYTSRTVQRDHMNEPTRLGLASQMTTVAGFRTLQLAPEGLAEFLNQQSGAGVTPEQTSFSAINASGGTPVGADKLGFEERGFFDSIPRETRKNLLKFLTPEELEKGILYTESQNAYQELLGLARLNAGAADQPAAVSQLRQAIETRQPYTVFIRLLAQFELHFRQISRALSVEGLFNPWPVVGFPVMVCREGRSYMGLLTGLQHTVSYSGDASTSYQIDYARLFRPESLNETQNFEGARLAVDAARRRQDTEFKDILTDLLTRGLLTQEEFDRLRSANLADLQAVLDDVTQRIRDEDQPRVEEIRARYRQLYSRVAVVPSGMHYDTWVGALFDYVTFALELVEGRPVLNPITLLNAGSGAGDLFANMLQEDLDQQSVMLGRVEGGLGDIQRFYTNVVVRLNLVLLSLRSAVRPVTSAHEGRSLFTTTAVEFNAILEARDQEQRSLLEPIDAEIFSVQVGIEFRRERILEREAGLLAAQAVFADQFRLHTPRDRREVELAQSLLDNERARLQELESRLADLQLQRQDTDRELRDRPPVFPWNWSRDVERLLRSFDQNSNDAAATAEFLSEPLDFSGVSLDAPANTVTAGLVSAVRRFLQGYREFFDGPIDSTVFFNVANTILNATTFFLRTREEVFGPDVYAAMDRVDSEYKVFRDFIAENQIEIPPLLPFQNSDLLAVAKVDEQLKDVIVPRNEEGKYTNWKSIDPVFDGQTELISAGDRARTLREEVIFKYDEFIRTARKIFPFAEGDEDTAYQQAEARGRQASWANQVQAREGVKMREFLARFGLTLEEGTVADEAASFSKGTYYKAVAEDGADLNSFFSKMGRVEANLTADPLGESLGEVRANAERGGSPDWQNLRASVRQKLVEDYTRRHVASRAFRGKR